MTSLAAVALLALGGAACGSSPLPAERPSDFRLEYSHTPGRAAHSSNPAGRLACEAQGCTCEALGVGVEGTGAAPGRKAVTAAQLDTVYRALRESTLELAGGPAPPPDFDAPTCALVVRADGRTYDVSGPGLAAAKELERALCPRGGR